jgi:hypothetical protein
VRSTEVTLVVVTAEVGGRAKRRRDKHHRRLVGGGAVAGAVLAMGAVAGAVVLVTGGGDEQASTSATTDRKPSTSTTTSSTTSTTVPESTTVVPRSTNPVVALAQQYDGYYEGTFANTTFQTDGTVTLLVRIDPNAGTLDVTAEFDGDVFGGGAKEIRSIQATVKLRDPGASVTTQTKSFGKVIGHIDPTLALILNAPDVPDPKVASFELTGRLRGDRSGFDATYHVTFEDEKTADGTIVVVCATRGQRPNEVQTLCATQ